MNKDLKDRNKILKKNSFFTIVERADGLDKRNNSKFILKFNFTFMCNRLIFLHFAFITLNNVSTNKNVPNLIKIIFV